VNRLKSVVGKPCLRQTVPVDSCGRSSCPIYVALTASADPNNRALCKNPGAACSAFPGLHVPDDAGLAAKFCDEEEAQFKTSGGFADPYTVPVCELNQLRPTPPGQPGCPAGAPADFDAQGSCAASADAGWCYVTGAGAGTCGSSIVFTNGVPPTGATAALVCPSP